MKFIREIVGSLTLVLTSGHAAAESHKEKQPEKTKKEKTYKERRSTSGFIFSPGFYRSARPSAIGYELSLLYNGWGPVVGFEDSSFKYFELELASPFLTLGGGIRKIESEEENGEEKKKEKDGTQITLSAPVFFLFPYGRWIQGDPDRKSEFGVMLKFPVSFGRHWTSDTQDED